MNEFDQVGTEQDGGPAGGVWRDAPAGPGGSPDGNPHGPAPSHRAPPPPPRWREGAYGCEPPPRRSVFGSHFVQSCLAAGCATIAAPFILVFTALLLFGAMAGSGLDKAASALDSEDASPNLRVKVVRKGDGDGTVALIAVTGTIEGRGSQLEGAGMMTFVADQLRAAAGDPAVKAIVLQVDSPGGGLTASDLIYDEVRRAKTKGKPVLAWAGGLMASGGYYIAAPCDGIMASPTATIGSIGVVMQHFQVAGLLERLGIKVDPLTTGARKDIGSPFREMTPEERKLLQEYIDHAHRRFIDIVAEGRRLPPERVELLADGRIFTADASLEYGLVDRIGYLEDALEWAEELTGTPGMRVIAYRKVMTLSDILAESRRLAADAFAALLAELADSRRIRAE